MADRRAESLQVTVVRTGGIAGLRREWTATASGSDADAVRALVDSDAWSAPPAPPGSVDRYTWSIVITGLGRRRTLTVPEEAMDAPVRGLVDRVRRDGEPVAPETRA